MTVLVASLMFGSLLSPPLLLLLAIGWLSKRTRLPDRKIGLIGWSYGAAVSIQAAAKVPGIGFVIADAVRSVMEQTVQPYEIVICDDGSPDDLDAGLGDLKDQVKIVRKENGGTGSALNAAAGAASGDYVVQLDVDDVFMPRRLEAISAVLTTRPDVAGYAERIDAILRRLREGAPRAALVTATAPEVWQFMGLRPRTEARLIAATTELNEATREVAARYEVLCLPVAGHPALREPATFSADGLHPSSAGHQTVAVQAAVVLHEHFGIEFRMEGEEAA